MAKVTQTAPLMNNDAQVSQDKRISLRQLIGKRLGFGSHFTYQNAKKIKIYANVELIKQVDQRKKSISKAAKLCPVVCVKKKKKITLKESCD